MSRIPETAVVDNETGAPIHRWGDEWCGDGWAQEQFREEEADGGMTNMADIREIRGERWANIPSHG